MNLCTVTDMTDKRADPLEPKELGTLIVVVGKAVGALSRHSDVSSCTQRNLPNKSRFGKQDPFCTLRVNEDKQRTKAIKR